MNLAVSKIISPLDTMLDPAGEDAYFRIGLGALEHCKTALKGKKPQRILDFPSGYGRVLRWFRATWPEAEIFASEIDSRCLDFVAQEFKAVPILADPHLKMEIPGSMDLIFSGSLLTHFDEWQWDLYLDMCVSALADDGVFVFTTHGRIAALLAQEQHPVYGDIIDTEALFKVYKEKGFAFAPYAEDYPTFGLSLSSPDWVINKIKSMPDVKVIGFEEGGWGQDIWYLQRNPWPMVKG
ncbi:SAM-dependent methyltransferase [Ochrobactrum teleogrylli]|uniref:SAM-dependent methyltransferase n=1 Tax=Ochrobactrum teleogrylli TaxID=2479765 RepID=UPI00384B4B8D